MTVVQYIATEEQGAGGHDPEKRRQVLAGAREVFLARGFDAASMGDIARTAGVSKGTLYVYFGSKQDLFAALVHEECAQTAERTLELGTGDGDLRAELITAGRSYIAAMIRPEHIATVRIVIAVGEKFPDISKAFLKAGLEAGVQRLSCWLEARIGRGELEIADPELAAWQFLIGCHAPIVMPILFGGEPAPPGQCVDHVVEHTVEQFLRAFAPRI